MRALGVHFVVAAILRDATPPDSDVFRIVVVPNALYMVALLKMDTMTDAYGVREDTLEILSR